MKSTRFAVLLFLGSLNASRALFGQFGGPAGPAGIRRVAIPEIPNVIKAGAEWKIAWQGTDNADGIAGTSDGGLIFAKEQPNRIDKLDKDDKLSTYIEGTHGAGSVSIDSKSRVWAVERTCTDPGKAPEKCTEPTAITILKPERKVVADHFGGKGLGRLNDLIVDRKGGAYFTSGGLFYVNAKGQVSSIGQNLRTNGLMLSRDEKTLYVTNGNTIVAFDVQTDGSAVNQRDFAKLEAGGNGDGMAIDSEGRLYVTSPAGVQILSPEGKYLGLIPTPRPVISVAFSGPGKKMLYVVGAGALGPDGKEFQTPPGVRNNAKTILKIQMIAQGFKGRAK